MKDEGFWSPKKDFSKISMITKVLEGPFFDLFHFFFTSIFNRLQLVSYDEITR